MISAPCLFSDRGTSGNRSWELNIGTLSSYSCGMVTYIETNHESYFTDRCLNWRCYWYPLLKNALICQRLELSGERGSTYSLSLARGPFLRFISKRCSFWYLSTISPLSEIQIEVFLIFPDFFSPGSWMPALIQILFFLASFCNPWT